MDSWITMYDMKVNKMKTKTMIVSKGMFRILNVAVGIGNRRNWNSSISL